MKKLVLIFVSLLILVSCSGGDEEEAKRAVFNMLKGPDSAKFGQFTKVSAKKYEMACLTVSVRTSIGGYEGNKEALLGRINGEKWKVKYLSEASHEQCVEQLKIYLTDK
jgi:hypothetical protein